MHMFACLLWLGPLGLGLAQTKTITGQLLNENGSPLPGATIIEQGTINGVTTDFDGNFNITINKGAVLNVSFVGYETQMVAIGLEDSYRIEMVGSGALEEVVITGYNSQRRSDVTGSAVQLNSDQINDLTLPTVDQALQGRVAGLNIAANSGTPGSTAQIRIRGISSITAGNEPLYVIDGVPVNNDNVSNSTASSFLSALAGIDTNNIKSITVLKDASSTAQYGARGSNGVILITTKKGQEGDTIFTFNTYYGIQNDATPGPVMLTAADRLQLFSEGLYNDDPETYLSIDAAENYIESWAGKKNQNSIFELAYSSTDNLGSNSIAYIYRTQENGSGYGDLQVLPEVANLYDATDVRSGILGYQGDLLRNMKKYPDINGFDNIPILRYEEVVLNYAEALWETGAAQEALIQLNALTQKRNAVPYDIASKENILLERRKELIFEGHRWDDLMRTSRSIIAHGTLMNELATYTYPNKVFAYPIPADEINANSDIVQNDGY